MRRLRKSSGLRDLVRETELSASHLISPLFVIPGTDRGEPIESMPGIERLSVDRLVTEAGEIHALGVPAVLLFGVPDAESKDADGSGAFDHDGVVQQAVRAIKQAHPDLTVVTDVCMCGYTSHGHCGVLAEDGSVNNDETLELLARTALSHAAAGADAVAPSDMMDGRIGHIRGALDEDGFNDTAIIAYSAKFASAFYGPFRDAAASSPAFGDRSGYQMDPGNKRQALREARLDIEEGADMVMVKPGLPYLDVIAAIHAESEVPVAAYNVSGEYSMLKAAIEKGYLDERGAVTETLLSLRRAGADVIITYHAKDFATWNQ